MRITAVPKDFQPKIAFPAYLVRKRLLEGITRASDQLSGKMLDFGCGSKPYKSLFKNVERYIGLDFENPGHSHANEQIDYFYDGHTIPFEDNFFDSIFSSEVFEHVFNLEQILPELHRTLRPGGIIVVTCPFAICEHEVPNDFARYSSFALMHLFRKAGFEIISHHKLGSSIEVITQLLIMYIHINIAPIFRKIPVVRSGFRLFTNVFLNLWALVLNKILPRGDELYLNNLIICKKGMP